MVKISTRARSGAWFVGPGEAALRCSPSRIHWPPPKLRPKEFRNPEILSHGPRSVGQRKCSPHGSMQSPSCPCDTPAAPHLQPSFRTSKCCTRVGHQMRPSEMHGPTWAKRWDRARASPTGRWQLRGQRRDSEVDATKRHGHGGGELPLQSRIGTYPTLVERRLILSNPAPSLHASGSSQGQAPSRSDTPRFGMRRQAAVPWPAIRLISEPESPSETSPQHYAASREDPDVLSPAWGPSSPASLGKGTPGCSDGAKSACMPVPLGIRPHLVPAFGTRCKMPLFEVLLFGAARSAGVQNATFAGVFVPQVWEPAGVPKC